MSKIICATKAAQNSRIVHETALKLAHKHDLELEFLHVIAVPNYDELMGPLQDAVRSELLWLVHSLTRISQQRVGFTASKPTVEVVSGDVREAILRYIGAEDVELLVMGEPDEHESPFLKSGIESFLVEVAQANARVELVET